LTNYNDENKVTLMKKGADDVILNALKMNADSADVVEKASFALGNFTLNKEFKNRLRDKGVRELAVQLQAKYPASSVATKQVNRLISNLDAWHFF